MSSNTSIISIDWDAEVFLGAPNDTGTPERNLLMAVLERAILDFVGNDRKEMEEAGEWFFDQTIPMHIPFSFGWICQQLDLDRKKIAEKVRAMPKRGDRRIAPWYFAKAS